MSHEDNHELEVKFPVASAEAVEARVQGLGAVLEQARRFERNLRFDKPSGKLSKARQVLRLRQNGDRAILTFKSDRNSSDTLADREEIETDVSDFERTRLILERLGFEVDFIYEKFRAIYTLDDCGIFIDHTPIGDYVEIEGPDEAAIQTAADRIGLDWGTRLGQGYRALFKAWKERTGFSGRDMTFN